MALNLAILFGGVGLRSRRGYGSLSVIETSDAGLIPISPTTLEEWPKHIWKICRSAIKRANELAAQNNVSIKAYLLDARVSLAPLLTLLFACLMNRVQQPQMKY